MTNHCAKIKYVYIMGPITPRGIMKGVKNPAIEYLRNVTNMIACAIDLVRRGFVPFCPAIDFPYLLADPTLPIDFFYGQSMAWLEKCDAVLALPGSFHKTSTGCIAETKRANELCIPIFRNMQELLDAAK